MDSLDGGQMSVELTIKRGNQKVTDMLGPWSRYLCELVLADAKTRPWFVSGKIVDPSSDGSVASDITREAARLREHGNKSDPNYYKYHPNSAKGAGGADAKGAPSDKPPSPADMPALKREPPNWSNRRAEAQAQHTVMFGGTTAKAFGIGVPRTGYMVSPYKGSEAILAMEGLSQEGLASAFQRYIDQHRSLLAQPSSFLGAWVDEGKIYMDISVRQPTVEEAFRLAREHDQKAIYNIATGESLYTDAAAGISEAAAAKPRAVLIDPNAKPDELAAAAAYLLGTTPEVKK